MVCIRNSAFKAFTDAKHLIQLSFLLMKNSCICLWKIIWDHSMAKQTKNHFVNKDGEFLWFVRSPHIVASLDCISDKTV